MCPSLMGVGLASHLTYGLGIPQVGNIIKGMKRKFSMEAIAGTEQDQKKPEDRIRLKDNLRR